MALRNYITASDLTSLVSSDFNVSGYIDRTNDHIEYLASTFGVNPSGIVYPVRVQTKEYAISYAYRSLYLDKLGTNTTEILDSDKYMVLYNMYNRELERLRKSITYEVIGLSGYLTANSTARTELVIRG